MLGQLRMSGRIRRLAEAVQRDDRRAVAAENMCSVTP
jgi:hypothetical protein